ncbi:hypothetical protein BJ170DRAFT_593718 [Xylariales sp. AK1849]|nr:hypothetical protein BJ170DRAFT_593718 [Xylariales sp. AK1849]
MSEDMAGAYRQMLRDRDTDWGETLLPELTTDIKKFADEAVTTLMRNGVFKLAKDRDRAAAVEIVRTNAMDEFEKQCKKTDEELSKKTQGFLDKRQDEWIAERERLIKRHRDEISKHLSTADEEQIATQKAKEEVEQLSKQLKAKDAEKDEVHAGYQEKMLTQAKLADAAREKANKAYEELEKLLSAAGDAKEKAEEMQKKAEGDLAREVKTRERNQREYKQLEDEHQESLQKLLNLKDAEADLNDTQMRLQQLEQENERRPEIVRENAKLAEDNEFLESRVGDLEKTLGSVERRLEAANSQRNALEHDKERLQSELEDAQRTQATTAGSNSRSRGSSGQRPPDPREPQNLAEQLDGLNSSSGSRSEAGRSSISEANTTEHIAGAGVFESGDYVFPILQQIAYVQANPDAEFQDFKNLPPDMLRSNNILAALAEVLGWADPEQFTKLGGLVYDLKTHIDSLGHSDEVKWATYSDIETILGSMNRSHQKSQETRTAKTDEARKLRDEEISKKYEEEINRTSVVLEEIRSGQARLREEALKRAKEWEDERYDLMANSATKIEELQTQIENLEAKAGDAEADNDAATQGKLQALQSDKAKLAENLEDLKKELDEANETHETYKAKHEDLVSKHGDLTKHLEEISQELELSKKHTDKDQVDLEDCHTQKAELKELERKAAADLRKANQQVEELKAKIETLESKAQDDAKAVDEKIAELKLKCAQLEREREDRATDDMEQDELIEDQKKKIRNLEDAFGTMHTHRDELENALVTCNSDRDRDTITIAERDTTVEDQKREISQLEVKLNQASTRSDGLVNAVESNAKALATCNSDRDRDRNTMMSFVSQQTRDAEEIENLKKKIEELKADLGVNPSGMTSSTSSEDNCTSARCKANRNQAKNELTQRMAQITDLETTLQAITNEERGNGAGLGADLPGPSSTASSEDNCTSARCKANRDQAENELTQRMAQTTDLRTTLQAIIDEERGNEAQRNELEETTRRLKQEEESARQTRAARDHELERLRSELRDAQSALRRCQQDGQQNNGQLTPELEQELQDLRRARQELNDLKPIGLQLKHYHDDIENGLWGAAGDGELDGLHDQFEALTNSDDQEQNELVGGMDDELQNDLLRSETELNRLRDLSDGQGSDRIPFLEREILKYRNLIDMLRILRNLLDHTVRTSARYSLDKAQNDLDNLINPTDANANAAAAAQANVPRFSFGFGGMLNVLLSVLLVGFIIAESSLFKGWYSANSVSRSQYVDDRFLMSLNIPKAVVFLYLIRECLS